MKVNFCFFLLGIILVFNPHWVTGQSIKLPIEMIGEREVYQRVNFSLTGAQKNSANYLYLQIHNLNDYSEGAQFQINDGDWVTLNNANADLELYSADAAYGGIGGGYATV